MEALSTACLLLILYALVQGAIAHGVARERAREARRAQLRAASRAIRLSSNPAPLRSRTEIGREIAFRGVRREHARAPAEPV